MLLRSILDMVLNVVSPQQQSKVADCIIAAVAINVVNMITFGNFPTFNQPDVAVE